MANSRASRMCKSNDYLNLEISIADISPGGF